MATRYDVDILAVRIALRLAERQRIGQRALLWGLPVSGQDLERRHAPVGWDTFVEICDRLCDALGGAEALADAAAALPVVMPEIAPVAPFFVAPPRLGRFFARTLAPRLFPCVCVTFDVLPDDLARVTSSVPPGYRSGESVFAAMTGAWRALPCFLGLPEACIEHATLTPERANVVLRLARARTFSADERHEALEAFALFAEDELRADAEAIMHRGARFRGASDVIARFCQRSSLTPRERDVLELLANGASNKEIGARLGCSTRTIEVHVSNVMRKARTQGRSALVAAVWQT